jgi:hypothetical protein
MLLTVLRKVSLLVEAHEDFADRSPISAAVRWRDGALHAVAGAAMVCTGAYFACAVAAFSGRERLGKREVEGITIWDAWNGLATPTRRFMATFGDAVLSGAAEQLLDKTAPDLIHIQHLMGWPSRC